MGVYNDLFLLSMAFTLWSSAKAFSNSLIPTNRKPDGVEWAKVRESFEALRKLSELINKVAGHTVTCYLGGRTIFHAIGFDNGTSDLVRLIIMGNFLVGTASVLILAADVGHQVIPNA